MQEQIHNEENQGDSFQQRFHHVFNGGFNKRGGFIRHLVFQSVREVLRQLVETIEHQLRCRHFVCAGGQFYPQPGGWLTIEAAKIIVFLRPHFDGGDIAQPYL
ncbi:Uncharacterised protein [Shigella sonnei]|nr:Uncharacterised protein [Shigella sonnei]CSP16925.1 Uncharacterised protein [Shigella sonnei]CSP42837.1 Uncharacterised protein [Shigella sonnei]CSQ67666.1 Uncharacterised protein [Shigella sonnei]CSR46472.1 Uncharacterised protein [Shigella sonnei]